MTFTNQVPRTESITGASLTGTTGTVNRTYALTFPNVLAAGLDIIVNNGNLTETSDFNLVGSTITFLNIIDDVDVIRINYFTSVTFSLTSTAITSTTLRYTNPQQFASVLGIKRDIPEPAIATSPAKETVGIGDSSTTVFYLDHQNLISDTYTLFSGSTEASSTSLTETTHYTIDVDTGKLTLTAAGLTQVGANSIYASYSYYELDIVDSYVVAVLARVEQQIDETLNTIFTDGTSTNPSYPSKVDRLPSRGTFDRDYYTSKRPSINIESTLNGSITAAATSIILKTGDGSKFPTSGTIVIEKEKITYTGITTDTLTGCTRGVDDSTAATHADAIAVDTFVVEISGTQEGTTPVFFVQKHDVDIFVDVDIGQVNIYNNVINAASDTTNTDLILPQPDVPNRIRLTYHYGYDTIPVSITRLTVLMGKQALARDNVVGSIVKARSEFNLEQLNVDEKEIQSIISAYRQIPMSNT